MKKLIPIIILLLLIGAGLFYWYEWRPTEIRKKCAEKVQKTIGNPSNLISQYIATQSMFDENYKKCLREHGLEE